MSHSQNRALRIGSGIVSSAALPASPPAGSPSAHLLRPVLLAILLFALLSVGTANGHPIHGTGYSPGLWSSWLTGFLHPLTGIDQVLAMLAVGLSAGRLWFVRRLQGRV